MEKIRVYELAKKLDISSKELVLILKDLDIKHIKNHMSSIDDETAAMVVDLLTKKDKDEVNEPEVKEPEVKVKEGINPDVKEQKEKNPKKDTRKEKRFDKKQGRENQGEKNSIVVETPIIVKSLADILKVSPGELIKKLMTLGVLASINQEVDPDAVKIVGEEFGYLVELKAAEKEEIENELIEVEDDPKNLKPRAPVVTVLGHVDHGKTSLLDAIRETKVTSQEAGGITQHIGAYQAVVNDQKVVFLDTPGHEAFTSMRARGAQVTDVAILVVAADDGVMPQTIEAINHVRAAGVPIIVAVNKIDKANANPDRVKQQLSEYGLVPEEWGGETIFAPVSALKGEGLDHLLEMIILLAEMSELKANPTATARGIVIEAQLDKGKGPVATILIQNGSLKVGDSIVCGSISGKVRAMINDKGKQVKKALPSMPVEVQGFSEIPEAGDIFQVVKDEKIARQIAEKRSIKRREAELQKTKKVSLDDLYKQIQEGYLKDLNIIIKGDVQGSVEALKDSLLKIGNEEVRLQVIHTGVGAVTESDIMLADASNAIIIGFNVRPEPNARKMAEQENVEVKLYRVIYEIIEDINAAMTGMLDPKFEEVILGRAEIRQTFKVSRLGTIAGCHVIDGKITRDSGIRVIRNGIVIHEGKIDSLKRFKDDVREVVDGYECGIMLERFNDIKEQDILEAFVMQEVKA
ncbi:translation initiation factor IF-2 [Candidatus Contubernalis alkaliaceticus]|uniref:translation initiation factor IF-2 n=1 Tax=Candidatus Contubernalis alkaliaceticus TaxID=338645 RepID=UPI001F4C116F|nr:translation initiation factor IF-2 [Candidatus Contubernalis alkalaceticus]UNC91836.1 translation initiation factor IF-2 [Candidatus Contubernalis alkalaceticus]